jgi:hypothetical protein
MRRIEQAALALALAAPIASGSALADAPQPGPVPSLAGPVSITAPAPAPAADIPVATTRAVTIEAKDPAVAGALQPNANPSALLFFTLMNSGGAGRYGR